MTIRHEIRFGRYCLHPADGLYRGRAEIRVTPKSLDLLRLLAERAGHVISKEEIFRAVWPDVTVSDAALASCIQELRRALRDDARRPKFIETVHRRGYRFVARARGGTGEPGRPPASIGGQRGTDGTGVRVPGGIAPPPFEPGAHPTLFVGRQAPLERMQAGLAKAAAGERQLIVVTGGPGTGKTTLVRTFLAAAAARERLRIGWGQSVERAGAGEPYGPLLDALVRLCRQPGGDQVVAALRQHAPSWLAQLPSLQTPSQAAALARRTAGVTRDRMQRELTEAIEVLAGETPLVLWIEDLHWSDVSTTDWLAAFACRPDRARVLVILTARRAELPAQASPLESALDTLTREGRCCDIRLSGLERHEVGELLARRHRPAPGAEADLDRLADAVHVRSAGTPLFVHGVLDDLVARGHLQSGPAGWQMRSAVDEIVEAVPDTVTRVIERQLARVDPPARGLLEIASVIGMEWSAALVAAAATRPLEEVESTFHAFARQGQFVVAAGTQTWPDGITAGRFSFVHALYRDVLRQRVPSGRSVDIHRRAGTRLEQAYEDAPSTIAAVLAMHFEEGREIEKAIVYRERAGAMAHRRRAYPEAQGHLARALELLDGLPPSARRDELEASIRITWGPILMATRGWGDARVADTYGRSRVLLAALPAAPERFPALWGLWLYYWGRGSLDTASELAEELASVAAASGDPDFLLQAEHAAWATAFSRGQLQRAYAHAQRGIAGYDEGRHGALAARYGDHDAGVCARMFGARALALLGREGEAVALAAEAVALARSLEHPVSRCLALVFASSVQQVLGNAYAAWAAAVEAAGLADEYGLRLIGAWARALEGWSSQAYGREAREQIRAAIDAARATGSDQFQPYMLGLLADVHLRLGEREGGLQVVREALAIAERTGERFYEAELLRLQGALLLGNGDDESRHSARAAFERSLAIATRQAAGLLATRASDALAKLDLR